MFGAHGRSQHDYDRGRFCIFNLKKQNIVCDCVTALFSFQFSKNLQIPHCHENPTNKKQPLRYNLGNITSR